jgi:lipopolysaccharide cholinephosphotransferase
MLKKLEGSDKLNFLNEINKFYDYDESIIKKAYIKYNIYEKKYGDTLVKISENTRNELYKLLENTVKFLNKKRIDYWLDGGTLLGACRDGKMIDVDDDIDLAIPYDSYIKLKEIIKTLKYDTFKKMYISKKYDIGFTIKPRSKNSIIDDDLYKFHIHSHLLNNDNLFSDLFLYTKIGDKYVINHKMWKDRNNFKIKYMYPFKKIQFGEHKYNCVRNPYDFLNDSYWFWKHLNLADHSHLEEITNSGINDRNKFNYFLLS